MTKRILAAALPFLIALALASGVQAQRLQVEIYMTYNEAVRTVRETGGAVHACRRVGRRHFHCRATWWLEQHEAEVEPDGSLVNETVAYIPEERACEVGLKGLRLNGV